MICQKTWPPGGRGSFSLCIYIENLKNLLVRNHWTDFINTWQKSFLVDPRPRLFVIMIRQKTWPPGGGGGVGGWGRGLFSLYIYIEKFKNLLVRNQWTNFNITWQECCFGDLYQDCSSRHYSSKTWPLGGEAYFPYISL